MTKNTETNFSRHSFCWCTWSMAKLTLICTRKDGAWLWPKPDVNQVLTGLKALSHLWKCRDVNTWIPLFSLLFHVALISDTCLPSSTLTLLSCNKKGERNTTRAFSVKLQPTNRIFKVRYLGIWGFFSFSCQDLSF